MRVFTRNGEKLDPHKQYEFYDQRLPIGWMLTAGADALAVFDIVETQEPDPEPEPEEPAKRMVTPAVFRSLFTQAEKLAITEAGLTDAQVRVFMDDAVAAPNIDLDYPPVVQGIQYLTSIGLLTPERATQVLAGEVQNAL